MSKINKHKLSSQPSNQLQQKFMQVSQQLGQEIANERRAIAAQKRLQDEQDEIESAFEIALGREREAAAAAQREKERKEKAEAAMKKEETPVQTETKTA